jgi:hypothetical protein
VGLPLLLLSASTLAAQSVGTFRRTGNMTTPRSRHTATLLFDGRILITGGTIVDRPSETVLPTATAEVYDPSTGLFTPTGNMTTARVEHTATLLADGRVFIVGFASGTAEIYDPSTGVFTAIASLLPNPNVVSATLLNDGSVFVMGSTIPSAVLYDPSSETFTPAGRRLTEGPRTPVLQADGNVLLLPTADQGRVPSVELYNPRTHTFSVSAWPFAAGFPWYEYSTFGYSTASANLLNDGKILLTLRRLEDLPNYYALLINPSGTFSGTGGQLTNGRRGQIGTSLSDGTVLITGGLGDQCGNHPGPTAEVYDPVSDKFFETDSMTTYRNSYTATLLRSGQVMIAGGMGCPKAGSGYSALASAELYSPASAPSPPELLSLSGDGRGAGAVQHSDTYQLVSAGNPAVAGEMLTVYWTGMVDGSVIRPQVAIGGRMAEVLWFGMTPGYAGLKQINVRVPAGVAAGTAVPVRLTYLGRPSNEVTIGVR